MTKQSSFINEECYETKPVSPRKNMLVFLTAKDKQTNKEFMVGPENNEDITELEQELKAKAAAKRSQRLSLFSHTK